MRRRRLVVPATLMIVATACSGTSGRVAPAAGRSAPAIASASVTSPVAPSAAAPRSLVWKGCRDGFECSTLAVPLDPADAVAGTVSLGLIRLRASRPSERIGSLLVNPGGPGVSAVDWLRDNVTFAVPETIRSRFDLVAFDPRGTTHSAPLRCADTAQLDAFFQVDPHPDDPAELDHLDRANQAFVNGCAQRSGRVLRHASTADAARDMDQVRAALHEPKLNYLGYSYGTALGAAYLDQFPTHVRAMVLDGALDPRLTWDQLLRGQARGFDVALGEFLSWCDRPANKCAFRQVDPGRLPAAFDRLAARVDKTALPGAGTRTVGPGEFSYGVGQALYSTSYWPLLGTALAAADRGNGKDLLKLSDAYLDRSATGYANTIEANFAVNCVDRPWPKDDASYQRLADEVRSFAPRFGPGIAWSGAGCGIWPAAPSGRPHPVSGAGSPSVVVIGTTRDPATPYVWAVGLAKQLAKGVLLTHDGDGHTVYRSGAPSCIVDPVDSYLLTGRAPAPGRC